MPTETQPPATAIAIIPARGGSKRIPRKNIRPFFGKPIISYSIQAALKAAVFDRVIVSTDDPEIAEVGRTYGAEIPFLRSEKTSGDLATTFDVLEEVLNMLPASNHTSQTYGCCIYPTAPFVTAEQLAVSLKTLMANEGATSLLPVVQFGFPIQRAFEIVNGRLQYINADSALSRSQDLPKTYHDAGQFYMFRASSILRSRRLIDETSIGIVTNELTCQDIDNEEDWHLAELKWQRLITSKEIA